MKDRHISHEDLKFAIESGEIRAYYQPQVSIADCKLVGVEALVRWQHPSKGMIGPNQFIPLAEECGLIENLTEEVFSQAVTQAREWQHNNVPVKVAINFSVDTLGRLDLPERFIEMIGDAGSSTSGFMVEVTESRVMQESTKVLETLSRLHLNGVGISIDDFGTGYSTLEQLRQFPFTELKIDRSFVNGAAHDEGKKAILESSISLAHRLGLETVAEGVENADDWNEVARAGCDLIQGFYVSRPFAGDELTHWLKDWEEAVAIGSHRDMKNNCVF